MAAQKPVAFLRGFAAAQRTRSGDRATDAGALGILALAGRKVAFVPGHPMNGKLTTPDDLELARRLSAHG